MWSDWLEQLNGRTCSICDEREFGIGVSFVGIEGDFSKGFLYANSFESNLTGFGIWNWETILTCIIVLTFSIWTDVAVD